MTKTDILQSMTFEWVTQLLINEFSSLQEMTKYPYTYAAYVSLLSQVSGIRIAEIFHLKYNCKLPFHLNID